MISEEVNFLKRLDSPAKREWTRIAPTLYRLERLDFSDGPRLASYCECFSNWKRHWRRIYEHESFQPPPEERKFHKKQIQQMKRVADKWFDFCEDVCGTFGFKMSAAGMNLRRSLPKVRISEPLRKEEDVNVRVRNRYGSK